MNGSRNGLETALDFDPKVRTPLSSDRQWRTALGSSLRVEHDYAGDLAAGPVAQVQLRHHVPLSFHGFWDAGA